MSDKKRFALWVGTDTLDLAKLNYKGDNCKTQSEYIEKAIHFYTSYINATHAEAYLPRILADRCSSSCRWNRPSQTTSSPTTPI